MVRSGLLETGVYRHESKGLSSAGLAFKKVMREKREEMDGMAIIDNAS